MSALRPVLCNRTVARILFATLLLGYAMPLLQVEHGPSETGGVLVLEWLPLVLLAIQTAFPFLWIWWLLAVCSGIYGMALVWALTVDYSPADLYRALGWLWAVSVVFLTHPRREGEASGTPAP